MMLRENPALIYICIAPLQILFWLWMLVNIIHYREPLGRHKLLLLFSSVLFIMQTVSCALLPFVISQVEETLTTGIYLLFGFVSWILWSTIPDSLKRGDLQKVKYSVESVTVAKDVEIDTRYLIGDDGEIVDVVDDEKPKHGMNSTVE
jgi:hypothetical protein